MLLLIAAVSGYVVLIGGMNLFLACDGPGWLIARATPDLTLKMGKAYTLWPGRVHYRDVDLEIHDTSVHVKIHVERGYVNVGLRALLSMRFVGTDVRAYAVELEGRTSPAGLSPARAATLPDLTAPKPPHGITDPNDLWGVELHLTEVTTKRAWINELRQVGTLNINGGFKLQPMRHLEIYPSNVKSETGDDATKIGIGDLVLLRAVALDLRVQLSQADVSGDVLTSLLKQLELRGEVDGHVAGLEPLNPFLGAAQLKGGTGPFKIGLALVNGVAETGTKLNYSAPSVTLIKGKLQGVGALFVTASAANEAAALAAHVDLRRLRLRRSQELVGRVKRLELKATFSNRLQAAQLRRASLDLTGARVSDVSKLKTALPDALKSAGGALRADAHAKLQKNKLSGQLKARWKRARLDVGESQLRGDAWLRAEFDSKPPFQSGKLSLLSLDLTKASVTGQHEAGPAFKLSLRGNAVDFNVKRPAASGLLRLTVSDTTSIERAAGVEPPGIVSALFGLGDVELLLNTRLSASSQDIRVMGGRSGSAELQGRFSRSEGHQRRAANFPRDFVSRRGRGRRRREHLALRRQRLASGADAARRDRREEALGARVSVSRAAALNGLP